MGTQTTNLDLTKPSGGETGWGAAVNANWDTLDAMAYVTTPICWNMMTVDPDAVGQGTWNRTVDYTDLYCGEFKNPTSANGDNFSVKVRCPAGTYALRFNAPKHTDEPILKVYIDDVQVGDAGGYDLYAASGTAVNFVEITGIALTAGEHTVKFKCSGKNASSSAYKFRTTGAQLQRTA